VGPGKILLVEENQDDAELASLLLRTELSGVEVVRVEDCDTLEEALDAASYDLVLSENCFSWGHGARVLSLVRRSLPGCPVVMLTGKGNEETACEAIKNGFADYVPKSARGYVTLAKRVQGIIAGWNRASVSDIIGQYQRLLELVDDAVFVAARDGLLLQGNPAFGRLVKSGSPAALRGRYLADFLQKEALVEFLEKLDPKGALRSAEMPFSSGPGIVRIVACLFSQGDRSPTLFVGKLEPVDEASRRVKRSVETTLPDCENASPDDAVDLEKLLDRLLADLKPLIEQSKATVVRGKMPAIQASYPDVVKLFRNLLSTVLELPIEEPPKVEISVHRMPLEWLFVVKDTSGRIADVQPDPRAPKSPGEEREEPSQGLAPSRLILELLGGRLWISSQTDEGFTIYFTLPAHGRDHQKAAKQR
jgi:CheY-like chemotaxis protein